MFWFLSVLSSQVFPMTGNREQVASSNCNDCVSFVPLRFTLCISPWGIYAVISRGWLKTSIKKFSGETGRRKQPQKNFATQTVLLSDQTQTKHSTFFLLFYHHRGEKWPFCLFSLLRDVTRWTHGLKLVRFKLWEVKSKKNLVLHLLLDAKMLRCCRRRESTLKSQGSHSLHSNWHLKIIGQKYFSLPCCCWPDHINPISHISASEAQRLI